ncbi:MAG: hypothetical protein ACYTFA_15990 [Planctomycetota bacterium]
MSDSEILTVTLSSMTRIFAGVDGNFIVAVSDPHDYDPDASMMALTATRAGTRGVFINRSGSPRQVSRTLPRGE